MTLIIMWYQGVCNYRQYTASAWLGLISAVYIAYIPWVYTQGYPEQLWFPLNDIHQPQPLRVNMGKPQPQTKRLMGSSACTCTLYMQSCQGELSTGGGFPYCTLPKVGVFPSYKY